MTFTKNIKIDDERYKKYFANQPQLFDEYQEISYTLNDDDKIGFMLTDWEYPLLVFNYHTPLKIEAINVINITANTNQKKIDVNVIIANQVNQEVYVYNNKTYKNITPTHQNIWKYKKIDK